MSAATLVNRDNLGAAVISIHSDVTRSATAHVGRGSRSEPEPKVSALAQSCGGCEHRDLVNREDLISIHSDVTRSAPVHV